MEDVKTLKDVENVKEKVLTLIKNLPNNVSYDDIMEAIYVNQKIDKGLDELNQGQGLELEQARGLFDRWL